MKKCVRIYIEGGAVGKTADSDFRRGWKRFLADLHATARDNGYSSLEVVRGKGRGNAFQRFNKHHDVFPNDLCVLLVDAETTVPARTSVWKVVASRKGDGWIRPAWATEYHLYLMTVFVETWLLTDHDALRCYFKRNFDANLLPATNLEARSKTVIERALQSATKNCNNGPYRHGQAHEIIELVSPAKVRTLYHGMRLFDDLSKLIRGSAT